MKTLHHSFWRFIRNESGATAIEYALIAAILGVGIIAGLTAMKTEMNGTFGDIVTGLKQ